MEIEPSKPLRVFYFEEVENPETLEFLVQQSSRHWIDASDWPLYNKAKEEFYMAQQLYQHDKQAVVLFVNSYRL